MNKTLPLEKSTKPDKKENGRNLLLYVTLQKIFSGMAFRIMNKICNFVVYLYSHTAGL